GRLQSLINFLRPGSETLLVIRLAAKSGNRHAVGGRVRAKRPAQKQQSKLQTTPHFRRRSHSDVRSIRAIRNSTGMSHRSRVSRDVIPASEYEISSLSLPIW